MSVLTDGSHSFQIYIFSPDLSSGPQLNQWAVHISALISQGIKLVQTSHPKCGFLPGT